MIKQCKYCNTEFESNNPKRIYCSGTCRDRNKHGVELTREEMMGIFKCKICGKDFKHDRAKRICSEECMRIYMIKYSKQRVAKGIKYERPYYNKICKHCNTHFVTQVKPTVYCSLKCAAKNNPATQRRNFKLYRGKEHLKDFEYRQWRTAVFERDNYRCNVCGSESIKGSLRAHHLEGWNTNIELRYSLNNGVTLCESCHLKFHGQYGYGGNTESQFQEFKGA